MKKNKVDEALDTLDIYTDEQRFFNNIVENATATTKQFEDSIKLQNWIKKKAEQEIEELGKQ